jgi:hypothetical protein
VVGGRGLDSYDSGYGAMADFVNMMMKLRVPLKGWGGISRLAERTVSFSILIY